MTSDRRMTFVSDRLVDQIAEGRKTASVTKLDEQGDADEWDHAVEIGTYYTVHDSRRKPRCVIRVTRMELCSWNDIPEWLWRGETNDSADGFREDHLDYFDQPSDDFEFMAYGFVCTEVLSDGKPT